MQAPSGEFLKIREKIATKGTVLHINPIPDIQHGSQIGSTIPVRWLTTAERNPFLDGYRSISGSKAVISRWPDSVPPPSSRRPSSPSTHPTSQPHQKQQLEAHLALADREHVSHTE